LTQEKEGTGVLAKKLKDQNSIGPGRAIQTNNSEATLKVKAPHPVEGRFIIIILLLINIFFIEKIVEIEIRQVSNESIVRFSIAANTLYGWFVI
jgi:hypothetical protein